MAYKVGDKIKFAEEKQSYTIQACNDRYLICTKPFNAKKTVFYTIVDLVDNIRGADWRVFCVGYETVEKCNQALADLQAGTLEISKRNRIPLVIDKKTAKPA